MGRTFAISLISISFLLTGCNGAFWGNIAILGLTVGIFVATLSLGRTAEAAAERSASSTTSRG